MHRLRYQSPPSRGGIRYHASRHTTQQTNTTTHDDDKTPHQNPPSTCSCLPRPSCAFPAPPHLPAPPSSSPPLYRPGRRSRRAVPAARWGRIRCSMCALGGPALERGFKETARLKEDKLKASIGHNSRSRHAKVSDACNLVLCWPRLELRSIYRPQAGETAQIKTSS